MNTIDDFNFEDKVAIVRVDFNVPIDENGKVADATRIEAAKPTIIKILEDGGSCILMSHLGRPKGKEEKYSLSQIVDKVEEILGVEVHFVTDSVGPEAMEAAGKIQAGEIILLENLRFHKEEEGGDEEFAEKLAQLADVYVNDAFGTAHRRHASTAVIADYFPEHKYFGYLMAKELKNIDKVLNSNDAPVLAILGGAKISSKITVIENILDKIDHLIIGGGMAFTFIKAQGGKIGDSIVEEDKLDLAREILATAKEKNVILHLPVDVVAAKSFDNNAESKIVPIGEIPDGWQGLDAGPKSREVFHEIILEAKTVLWNGPVGVFEMDNFAAGTIALADSIVEATEKGAFTLVGGGDSVAAVKQFGYEDKVSYVSTGGGAMLESLEGKTLPGVAAIYN
ncbi:MAG: phosphoglycerate kinase [Flavobacteriaceae bacterium]|nr:phosphoglycerate kinase [Flavobacteriaceae bacterium]